MAELRLDETELIECEKAYGLKVLNPPGDTYQSVRTSFEGAACDLRGKSTQ